MVDCHFHIFGPEYRYPYVADRIFTPEDASPGDYMRVCTTLGIDRAVLVQPSVYGADNSRLIDAARELAIPTRAVIVASADISDAELDALQMAGARGLRVIRYNKTELIGEDLEYLAARLGERGWHLQLLINAEQVVYLQPRLEKMKCPVVIDHLAHISAAKGRDDIGFNSLRRLVESGICWLKLTGGYRISTRPAPHDDAVPLVRELVSRRPDRFVWGTDWPHVVLDGDVPNTADVVDLLLDWVPDEDQRYQILVRNPEVLYGFEPVATLQSSERPDVVSTYKTRERQ
jgi:predicted TIM-barrel fold metal-dependent hydrolase